MTDIIDIKIFSPSFLPGYQLPPDSLAFFHQLKQMLTDGIETNKLIGNPVFDFSYLDRISSDSKQLHLEVLKIFKGIGDESAEQIEKGIELQDGERIVLSINRLLSNLRILGLHDLLLEAELIGAIIQYPETPSTPPMPETEIKRINEFLVNLKKALIQSEVEIQKYRKTLNV